jgi:hypothetical protein
MRIAPFALAVLLAGCPAEEPTTATEADADADADADSDTDADADTDTRPDCPDDGRGGYEVTFTNAPTFATDDALSAVLFVAEGGVPSWLEIVLGDDAGSVPYVLVADDVPPNSYGQSTFCHDVAGDTSSSCETGADVLVFGEPTVIEEGRVTRVTVDFAAGTATTPVVEDAPSDCP